VLTKPDEEEMLVIGRALNV